MLKLIPFPHIKSKSEYVFFLLQVAVDKTSVLALETKRLFSDILQAIVAAFEVHGSFTFCDIRKI